jgi:hypothetical protein
MLGGSVHSFSRRRGSLQRGQIVTSFTTTSKNAQGCPVDVEEFKPTEDTTTEDTTTEDTSVDTSVDTAVDPVADTLPDTTIDTMIDPEPDGPPPCDRFGFDMGNSSAEGSVGDAIFFISDTPDFPPGDTLHIEFYYRPTPPYPLNGPGSYVIGSMDADQGLGTCTTCITIHAGSDGTGYMEKQFFAIEGELEILALTVPGEQFAGSLTNVRFVEVFYDGSSGVTHFIEDGESWCIEELIFEAILHPFPG